MGSPGLFQELDGLALEHQTLISRFGRGPTIPVPYETVHGAFESIVDAHPSTPAAKYRGKAITYAELDAAANRLTNYLIDTGLAPKQRVCLVVQRSFEMLVGILAVLKAGCQYVPVDGGITSDQALQHILRDTNSCFVLFLPKFEEKVKQLAESDVITVVLGVDVEAFSSKARPSIPVSASDGVYAIYTSGKFEIQKSIRELTTPLGSTGAPKGVDVSHGNVTNALLLQPGSLGIRLGTRVAQVLNIAFDMGMFCFERYSFDN